MAGYASAMEMRDLVSQLVREELSRQAPAPTYATVYSIDAPTRSCLITFPGEVTPVKATYGSVQPNAVGQLVRVEGPPGQRYIADVLGDTKTQTDLSTTASGLALKANIASPTFTGNPASSAAPTLAAHLVNKTYADLKAPIASPTFTGNASQTANPTTDSHLARKAYVDLPALTIRRSTSVSIPNFSFTNVPMNIIEVDARATGLSSQSDGIGAVIRETGFYRIDASVRMAAHTTGVRLLSIDLTGFSNVGADHRVAMPHPDDTMLHAGFMRYLTAGTTVRVFVFQNSGGNLNALQNHSQMSVHCVRR
jgi:hypothetical protein